MILISTLLFSILISQFIRSDRVSSHFADFNACNNSLPAKPLQQGYRYIKLRKAFSKFYRRHFELISNYKPGLRSFLQQGLSESEVYSDLVYKFRKIAGKNRFFSSV